MKSNYLFPNRFKKNWLVLFIPGVLLGIVFLMSPSDIGFFDVKVFSIVEEAIFNDTVFFTSSENNILDEIAGIFIIIGALLIAFPKKS